MKKIILCVVVLLTVLCGVARSNGVPLSVRYMQDADECIKLDKNDAKWKAFGCDKLGASLSHQGRIGLCKELRTGMRAPKCSDIMGGNNVDPKWVEDFKYRLAHNDSTHPVPLCTDLGPKQYQPAWELLKCEKLLQSLTAQQSAQSLKQPVQVFPEQQETNIIELQTIERIETTSQKPPELLTTPIEKQPQQDYLYYGLMGAGVFLLCGFALWLLLRARKQNPSGK
ncbi:MAG: hypothetical protein IKP06_02235 [Elusimicrobiaceae bacterium]|nr:hypothetical protein [Elusimicrobiaceae bacterium]